MVAVLVKLSDTHDDSAIRPSSGITRSPMFQSRSPYEPARIHAAADYWLAHRPRYHGHEQGFDLILLVPRRWPRHVPNGL